ncbi:hypothetical protein EXIGLDRAFT_828480 [Exidia glandulosa HHB12029]|uniref:Large ribosomal subunit protein uL30m n=1 Tax=Exidia glandulosa HHB12029 TaxID=1314781 RepID=A0A165QHL4_EXIGL|nr:hypothetical protein EXIGLDRAFT_828480 [Exidia glandulosa HHB12029]
MSALARIRAAQHTLAPACARLASTSTPRVKPTLAPAPERLTHFRITLRRSAIALPERYQRTLESLGLHKRMQTVYQPHSQCVAGKILMVKELVEVANVPASAVRTRAEQRAERRPPRGYSLVKGRTDALTAFAEGHISVIEQEEVANFEKVQ